MATIGRIAVDFTVLTKGVATGLQSVTSQIAKTGKRITSLGGRIGAGFARGTVAIGKFAAAGTALAGGALVAGLSVATKSAFATMDAIGKLSDRTGFATEDLVALGFAAEQTGVTQEAMAKGLEMFTRRLGEAKQGSGEAVQALESLGLSAEKLANVDPGQALRLVADQIAQIPTQAEKAAVAADLFGRSGVQLVNLLQGGAPAINAFRAEAEQLGLTFSRMDASKVEAANDAMNRVRRAIGAAGQQIAVAIAPAIEGVANWLVQFAPQIKTFGQGFMDAFIGIGATIRATFAAGRVIMDNFGKFVFGIGQNIFATFKATWSAVVAGAISVYNNAGRVFKDLGAVVISFAKATWEALKAAFSLENPIKAFRETFAQEFSERSTGGLAQVGEDMAKAFADTYRANASDAAADVAQQAKDAFAKTFTDTVNAFDRKAKNIDLKPIEGPQVNPQDVALQDQKPVEKIKQSLKAVTRGSSEAIQAIAAILRGPTKNDPQEKLLRATQEQLAAIREQTAVLRKRLDLKPA